MFSLLVYARNVQCESPVVGFYGKVKTYFLPPDTFSVRLNLFVDVSFMRCAKGKCLPTFFSAGNDFTSTLDDCLQTNEVVLSEVSSYTSLNINRFRLWRDLAFSGWSVASSCLVSRQHPSRSLQTFVAEACDISCIEPSSTIWSPGPMLTCVPRQRDLRHHSCAFSWKRQTHKTHWGALLFGGSVPLNCCIWPLALCLFITIVKAPHPDCALLPASSKPIQKHFWKAWSGARGAMATASTI